MGRGAQNPLVLPSDAKELLSGPSYAATKLSKEDAWISEMDLDAFTVDVANLGKQLSKNQGPADVAHLSKIIWWSRLCQMVGLALAWRVNPVSIFLLSLGTMTRWTIVGHHVCHGGFDKISKYSRFTFGLGLRRLIDWLDWMLVEAWNVEHNQLHHYHLGEEEDPDLVEMNMDYLRQLGAPRPVKYLAVFLIACTWKWWYYAPNTYKALKSSQRRKKGLTPLDKKPQTFDFLWFIGGGDNSAFNGPEFIFKVLAPYFIQRFVLLPLPFILLGYNILPNLIFAEILTNLHSFLVIATNHAGDDLYRFNHHCRARSGTFYLRQVISSANFTCGNDYIDFLQGFLNYQIEHHIFPDLSMLSYQKAQPLVKQICEKHHIPYVQHNVFYRLKKLIDIMVGDTTMRKYPSKFENQADLVD